MIRRNPSPLLVLSGKPLQASGNRLPYADPTLASRDAPVGGGDCVRTATVEGNALRAGWLR